MRNYTERRVTKLIEGGFSEDEARRILQQESEAAFKSMQLLWEAQRAGEDVNRFDPSVNPQVLLRDELGDAAYARYLEAQGQPTSVRVSQVLSGSPAKSAGLQPGDQLVSYNGARIFNVGDLRNLTMQGEPGEDVVIEVERDGVRMQLTVPRGPIGITGSGANVRGLNWWGG
jgi:membrane-associated protease RseP (regulator of RpoE activity)